MLALVQLLQCHKATGSDLWDINRVLALPLLKVHRSAGLWHKRAAGRLHDHQLNLRCLHIV